METGLGLSEPAVILVAMATGLAKCYTADRRNAEKGLYNSDMVRDTAEVCINHQ